MHAYPCSRLSGFAYLAKTVSAARLFEEEAGRSSRDGFKAEREAFSARLGETEMASVTKITLSASRDIPFNKLILSQSNVRRIKAGVSIEELAEDIARRTLLQSLTVRPVVDADGQETGMFEIPAGGRRFRALELLVKQKRLAKTAPIPCVIREGGIAEEDSLAENIQRAPLHPLDQFRAFQALREKGRSEEEIAAAFFVSVAVVRQRLRLAAVSPRLLEVYAEDALTLDQLMAFTVNGDHERQEQVFERLAGTYNREPYLIRRMLTEGAVRAADKRAQFIGLDAYEAAGGTILNDLFQGDDGGWLQDVALVDRLVAEKLEREAAAIRAEGWRWVEVAPDFPYGHTYGLRHIRGEVQPLSDEEEATRGALFDEQEQIEAQQDDGSDLSEDADQRLSEIEAALSAFDNRPVRYAEADIARAGAFVSINADGELRIERGFVRPEDEEPIAPEPEAEATYEPAPAMAARIDGASVGVQTGEPDAEPEEEDGLKPLPERLVGELTTHRTLALRHALGEQPEIAFLAALHAMCLRAFYRWSLDSCLEIELRSSAFATQPPGLNDTPLARQLEGRHQSWAASLPKEPDELWDTLIGFEIDSRLSLFAHCVALSVNAVIEPYNRRPRAVAHADRLAGMLELDMVQAGWKPTIDTYLGRVTKARILEAVRQAKGERAAESIAHLRRHDMAEKAAELLHGSGWLPDLLRTPGLRAADIPPVAETDTTGDEPVVADDAVAEDDETAALAPHAEAAE